MKRELYAEHGVEEYWPIDLENRSVERFNRRPEAAGLVLAEQIGSGGLITTPLLPGFQLAVDRLFE